MLFALLYETRGCGLILLVVCLLWDSRLPLLGRNLFLFLLSSLDWFQIRYELVGQSFRYCWFWIWETVWFQFSGDQESKLRYMSYLWSCEDGVSMLGSCILTRQDHCDQCKTLWGLGMVPAGKVLITRWGGYGHHVLPWAKPVWWSQARSREFARRCVSKAWRVIWPGQVRARLGCCIGHGASPGEWKSHR